MLQVRPSTNNLTFAHEDVNKPTFNYCRHIQDFERKLQSNAITEGINFKINFVMLLNRVIFAVVKQKRSLATVATLQGGCFR